MNYKLIYDNIIKKARLLNRKKNDCTYYEKHHIIPKCLGGDNTKNNLVLLTFKEHFICHKLLYKIHENSKDSYKLMYALHRMYSKGNTENVVKSGKFYQEVKQAFCKNQSEKAKSRKYYKHSAETREKIGLKHKGKKLSKDHLDKIKQYNIDNREKKSTIAKNNHAKGLYKNKNVLKELWQDENFRKNLSNKIKQNYIDNPKLKQDLSERMKIYRKNNNNGKKIYYKDLIFNSMKEAADHANMNYQTFVSKIKNNKNFQYTIKAFGL